MPLYGVAQAGSNPTPGLNLTGVGPGETFTLFSSSDTVTSGTPASVAFMPAAGPTLVQSGITFTIDWEAAPTATVAIQGANQDVDADYQTLYTSTNKQHDHYADVGGFLYYRAQVTAYTSGTSVVVLAKR